MTCGNGIQIRTRQIEQEGENGGEECKDEGIEEKSCNITCPCPPPKVLKERCTCKETCIHLAFPDACVEPENCELSCECPDGYVEDLNGNCLKPSQCPCLDLDGKEYQEGETFITEDQCQKWYCIHFILLSIRFIHHIFYEHANAPLQV